MEPLKSIASLSWRDTPCPLREVLNVYTVPNLVRIEDGHLGKNDACSFEVGQILMLHTVRQKQRFLGEDSVGRPIAIPDDCDANLLVRPWKEYCKDESVYVCELPKYYPDIKYFRVVKNTQNKGFQSYFKEGTTVEIEYIDEMSILVKFKDIKETLPFNCSIEFEALLDFREHTLKSAVRAFGLPIKVRFLTSGNKVESPSKYYEKSVIKLGLVSIHQISRLEVRVLATDLDDEDLDSVKVSLISKDCDLSVTVPEKLLDGDTVYLKMVEDMNKTFFDRYDVKALENVNTCQYLDGPDGNTTPEITFNFVLKAKITDNMTRLYEDVANKRAGTSGGYCQFEPPPEKDPIYLLPADDHGLYHVYESMNENDPPRYDNVNYGAVFNSTSHQNLALPQKKINRDLLAIPNENSRIKDGVLPSKPPPVKPKPRTRPKPVPRDRKPERRNLGKANGFDSARRPVIPRQNGNIHLHATSSTAKDLTKPPPLPEKKSINRKNHNFYETTSSMSSKKPPIPDKRPVIKKPPIPDKRPVIKTLKAGEITAKNSTAKPENDTTTNEIQNLEKNSLNHENKPIQKNLSTQRPAKLESRPISIQKDLSSLSMAEVGELLSSLNMHDCINKFRKEQIDGKLLMSLDKETLLSLDLKPIHLLKLTKLIEGWRPNFGTDTC